MAIEPFLTNPLGEEVLIMGANPWYGDSAGHSRAARKGWRKRRRRSTSAAPRRRRRRRSTSAAPRRRRRRTAAPVRRRRRRRTTAAAPVRRRRRRRTTAPARRRRRRRTTAAAAPRRRRRRRSPALTSTRARRSRGLARYGYYGNPRRRRRRNPVLGLSTRGLAGQFQRVLPLAVTGGASIVVTKLAPDLARQTNPYARVGVQVATAFGGGMVIRRVVSREHATVWTVTGMAVVAADLIQRYVMTRIMPGIAGFSNVGAFPYDANYGGGNDMGAYPEEVGDDYGTPYGGGGEVAY